MLRLRLLALALIFSWQAHAQAHCPPAGHNSASLQALKTQQWQIKDTAQRQALALALLSCLSEPDPTLRDGIAFEALSHWMRNELLTTETLQDIRQILLSQLNHNNQAEQQGFGAPFAALVLAEVARVDRRTPFLSEVQREEMLQSAASFLSNTKDYRGYDEKEGWRHRIAHGADWIMQLGLNPALTLAQQQKLLAALAPKIANEEHFYIYGESARLAAPVLYIAMRSGLSSEQWREWFVKLVPPSDANQTTTQKTLARHHNLTAFLSALYVSLQESKQAQLKEKLLPLVVDAIKRL